MCHQCLIDLDGTYLAGAFFFSPILKIGPLPAPATPDFTELTEPSMTGRPPGSAGEAV